MQRILFLVLFFSIILLLIPLKSIEAQKPDLEAEVFVSGLKIPWSIAFAPDGRIFVTERVGNLRVIENGILQNEFVHSIDVGGGEGGLLGIVLDPNFSDNHYLYLYYTSPEFLFASNKVVRFTEIDNMLSEKTVLLDGIPAAFVHDGGRLKFGPDGKLYITTGDAGNSALAQDLNSLSGKILRINPDGSIPDDNPFSNSLVFSYGHRNPQGLDWDPETGKLVITEHGPSGEKGFAHDEINVVESGNNFGWPSVVGSTESTKYVNPIIHSGDITWAPSGATFYTGDEIPELKGKFLFASLRGQHLRILELDTENNQVLSNYALFQDSFGRLRDIAQGPDGYLYLLTSNRDGRGSPSSDDDRILKITLAKPQIPNWVLFVASWWWEGKISDIEFLNGMKYLIQNEIIHVSESQRNEIDLLSIENTNRLVDIFHLVPP